jgi:hypothetical protein
MSGLVSRLNCARRVAVELAAAGSPAAATIRGNEPFYFLGALGPALGDFVPHEVPEALGDPGRTPYFAAWVKILEIAVGNPDKGLPGVVPTLAGFNQILGAVRQAVEDQDLGALTNIRDSGDLDRIEDLSNDLGLILTYFSDVSQLTSFGQLMGSASRPVINDPLNLVPESLWTGRDYLTWKKTGKFATALMREATDDQQRAYAIGWQVAYATQLSMSGYVTSAVGSVYRTHWWRHRWVCNFIDSWVWGFYNADGRDDGKPEAGPFAAWRPLCNARLHTWIDVTGGGWDFESVASDMARNRPLPDMLPASFTAFWVRAFGRAYGTVTPPLFTERRLQVAYAALGTVLWFQTSGVVIGCNPLPGAPPAACNGGTPPDWIDPTQTNPATGGPFEPPAPNAEHQPDVAKIVSGIILAILGIAAAAFGGFLVGAAAIAGGVALIVDGVMQANWDELTCDLYWIDVYLFNGLEALHRLTVFGGLQHPYPRDLDVDELILAFNGASLPFASGPAVIRSRAIESLRQPWGGTISTWAGYPTEPVETPVFPVFPFGRPQWPNLVIDDDGANPQSTDILGPAPPWPGGNIDRSFGPAVQNAIHILKSDPRDLPDWNLDGDRGAGWLTWEFATPYAVPVAAVPET